jgi:peptidoglycan hydrolase-like amidase
MHLMATASLNAKTTTASDLTSNMTNNLKHQFKQKVAIKREILTSQSAAQASKKSLKPQIPQWKRDKSSVSQQDLEIFSQMLQDGETLLQ